MSVASFSLKRRLLFGSVIAIAVATTLAGIGLDAISGLAIRALAQSQIDDEMRLLLASVEVNASNELSIDDGPQDSRFEIPNGGFYWQVGRSGKVELRSTSLWDEGIAWLNASSREAGAMSDVPGPNNIQLLAVERSVMISTPSGEQNVTALIALDNSELGPVRWRFFYAMAPSLVVLMLALIGAIVVFLRYGLRPLDNLSLELRSLRDRSTRQISGRYPDEIQPLIDSLNLLMTARDSQLQAARARAGDLAHGLKTPLAVLEATARNLAEAGQVEASATVREEVWRMDAQVRRTLAQTRASLAAAQSSRKTNLSTVLTKVVSAMRKLEADSIIKFEVQGPSDVMVMVDESDLTNIAGNVLDNARKWALSHCLVTVVAHRASTRVEMQIEDDGPGLPSNADYSFIKRGKRLDETISGTGFGLAIAKDIVEAYGGDLEMSKSDLGGLKVSVRLPRGVGEG